MMRSGILYFTLKAFFVLTLINHSLANSPFFPWADDPLLQTLLEARRDTLKQIVGDVRTEVEIGQAEYAELSVAELALTEAELDASDTSAERIACLQKSFEIYKEIERQVEADADFGRAKAVDVKIATAARLKAEAELYKARINLDAIKTNGSLEGPSENQTTNEAVLREILEKRRNTLIEAAQLIAAELEGGVGSLHLVSKVCEIELEAILEQPDGWKEGIAILEKILADKTKVEEHFQTRWKANNLNEQYFRLARADREEAAINLHKAKTGTWPPHLGRYELGTSITQEESIDQELQTLLVEHRDTLKTIRLLVDAKGRSGMAKVSDMISANYEYFNSELELAKSLTEQVAFLQVALKIQSEVEHLAKGRHAVGTLPEKEFLLAKAARMKVEIELHKTRKRAK